MANASDGSQLQLEVDSLASWLSTPGQECRDDDEKGK